MKYEDWGCVTVWDERDSIDGWLPMADLYLIYDYISFEAEYGTQFRAYDGEFAHFTGLDDGITFWAYPGAAQPSLGI